VQAETVSQRKNPRKKGIEELMVGLETPIGTVAAGMPRKLGTGFRHLVPRKLTSAEAAASYRS
jgi:hypothetical protein